MTIMTKTRMRTRRASTTVWRPGLYSFCRVITKRFTLWELQVVLSVWVSLSWRQTSVSCPELAAAGVRHNGSSTPSIMFYSFNSNSPVRTGNFHILTRFICWQFAVVSKLESTGTSTVTPYAGLGALLHDHWPERKLMKKQGSLMDLDFKTKTCRCQLA